MKLCIIVNIFPENHVNEYKRKSNNRELWINEELLDAAEAIQSDKMGVNAACTVRAFGSSYIKETNKKQWLFRQNFRTTFIGAKNEKKIHIEKIAKIHYCTNMWMGRIYGI